ncbi:class I SAM-dependent DNA methyltransferase [Dyadobacter flavalbus]
MNHFLARLIFCFFAEDTGIFKEDGLFTSTVQTMSAADALDIHEIIGEIFRAMDTKKDERSEKQIKNWAAKFPYVNGQLFSGSVDVPKFTKIARSYLLHVGNLDWKKINPDIFGSMIQAVADDEERRDLGMHYTSVPNILKVLNPLFLEDLRTQLKESGENSRKLLKLRNRIAHIRVFDPACGSGNFLVIAYKQMREIEAEINERRGEKHRESEIPLTNFRGIELKGFSAEIARLALIIAEYQCDVLYRGQKLALADFLPLSAENWIFCGNALRVDWLSVFPPSGTGVKLFAYDLFSTPLDQSEISFDNEGGERYICGNPPYKGSSEQTKQMKNDLELLLGSRLPNYKSLDYVAGWLIKASDYCLSAHAKVAFVTTNSICQGSHVPILWPYLFMKGQKIFFAHTSFKWKNLAAKNAGVIVIILGITNTNTDTNYRQLFSENDDGTTSEKKCSYIGPYLVPEVNVIVQKSTRPIDTQLLEMDYGSKAADGKNLNFDSIEADIIRNANPRSNKFIFPYISADDAISGRKRYCLWIEEQNSEEAYEIKPIRNRIDLVRSFRLNSTKKSTRVLAQKPYAFAEQRFIRDKQILVVPSVSSQNRNYLPITLIPENTVVTNAAFAFYGVPLWCMALIASKVHIACEHYHAGAQTQNA